jgi:tetratricopeptide (TPR) repeat protein
VARPAAPPAELRAAPLAKASSPPTGRIPVDLIRLLEEVESYVSLGFVDDAKEALREGSLRFKDHPVLLQKIAELGLDESAPEPEAEAAAEDDLASQLDLGAPSPAAYDPLGHLADDVAPEPEPSATDDLVGGFGDPAASAYPDETTAGEDLLSTSAESVGEGGMDLGAELGELFGAQSAVDEPAPESASTELGDAGLADIFKEFKKGVDKQLGKEDYDTRYNLGIAYKEMGLIDEAIAEFQLAAKDEARLLECASMLGICFLEKGMPKLAMKWFERGLKAPGRTEEEYAALRYDLATAHEAAGDVDRALALFTDLYGQDANFRDVATKVRDLRAMVQG